MIKIRINGKCQKCDSANLKETRRNGCQSVIGCDDCGHEFTCFVIQELMNLDNMEEGALAVKID